MKRVDMAVSATGALLAVLLLAAPATGTEPVSVENVLPGTVLMIREGPSDVFEPVGVLPDNAHSIRSYDCSFVAGEMWCEIEYLGTRGWVQRAYLGPVERLLT